MSIPTNVTRAVLDAVQPIPASPEVFSHKQLATTAIVLAHALGEALQETGFDLSITADDTKYLTTVERPRFV